MENKNFILNLSTNNSNMENVKETLLEKLLFSQKSLKKNYFDPYSDDSGYEFHFNKSRREVFQEHSNNLKSILDELKKKVKEPSIDPQAGPLYSYYAEKFEDLPHKKVEELEKHYSNLTKMLEKRLTKDNLQKVLFNEENLDNSLEVGSTEVNTNSVMGSRKIFWDFHNKFKTTIYKIKNMSEPSSADPTAGVFDPSYLTQHKLGTEKEFFHQMDHHEYLRFPLEHIQDVHKFKLNSTSESLAERSRLQHEQTDRFFEADLNNAYNSQSNFQDRLRFFQESLDYEHMPIAAESFFNNLRNFPGSYSDLIKASNFYRNVENKAFFATTFETTKVYGNYILKHPNIKESIDLVSNKLINDLNCTTANIDLLELVCYSYESFSFVTLEPCLFKCLGPLLFFKIFCPLHHTGAFTLFMNNVISEYRKMDEQLELWKKWSNN